MSQIWKFQSVILEKNGESCSHSSIQCRKTWNSHQASSHCVQWNKKFISRRDMQNVTAWTTPSLYKQLIKQLSAKRCACKPLVRMIGSHFSWHHTHSASYSILWRITWFIRRRQHRHRLLMNEKFCMLLKVVEGQSRWHRSQTTHYYTTLFHHKVAHKTK